MKKLFRWLKERMRRDTILVGKETIHYVNRKGKIVETKTVTNVMRKTRL